MITVSFHQLSCGDGFCAWPSIVQEIIKEVVLDSNSERCILHWLRDSWSNTRRAA